MNSQVHCPWTWKPRVMAFCDSMAMKVDIAHPDFYCVLLQGNKWRGEKKRNLVGSINVEIGVSNRKKIWLNVLICLFWWLLDTWVSSIEVRGQVLKEVECVCVMQNRIRLNCTGWHRPLLWWQYLSLANRVSAATTCIQKDTVSPLWRSMGAGVQQ